MNRYLDVVQKMKSAAGEIPLLLEKASVRQTEGRVLGEDVYSSESIPSFDNSSMDGFAIRTSELGSEPHTSPRRLKVLKRVIAGDDPESVFEKNIAVEIMTGARSLKAGSMPFSKSKTLLLIEAQTENLK